MPGNVRSSTTRSGGLSETMESASSPLPASATSKSQLRKLARNARRNIRSSSTKRIALTVPPRRPRSAGPARRLPHRRASPRTAPLPGSRRTSARTMARPSPVPCPSVGAPRRVNSSKIRSRSGTGMPGPWSITRSSNHRPRTPPRTSIAPPDGSWTAMFSSRFTSTCSMNNASTHSVRQLGIEVEVDRPAVERAPGTVDRERTRSTAETVTSSGRSAPARMLVSSRTLFTSPSSRAASAKVSSSSSRRSVGSRRESSARSAAVAALMVASGVRRSWVTPVRNPARDRSRSPCTRCSRGGLDPFELEGGRHRARDARDGLDLVIPERARWSGA